MLTMSEKILFVWFAWLVSKLKNKLFFCFLSRFVLLILHLGSEAATSSVLILFTVVAIFSLLLNRQLLLIIKIKLC